MTFREGIELIERLRTELASLTAANNKWTDEVDSLNGLLGVKDSTIASLRTSADHWFKRYKEVGVERDNLQRKFDYMAATSVITLPPGYTWVDKVNDLLKENQALRADLVEFKKQTHLGIKVLSNKLGL